MKRLGDMARSPHKIQCGITQFPTIEEAKRHKGAAWQVRPDL